MKSSVKNSRLRLILIFALVVLLPACGAKFSVGGKAKGVPIASPEKADPGLEVPEKSKVLLAFTLNGQGDFGWDSYEGIGYGWAMHSELKRKEVADFYESKGFEGDQKSGLWLGSNDDGQFNFEMSSGDKKTNIKISIKNHADGKIQSILLSRPAKDGGCNFTILQGTKTPSNDHN